MSKTALVTGASSGIGYATVLELSNSYDNIIINSYHNPDKLFAVKKELTDRGINCTACVGDISDYAFTSYMINDSLDSYGSIDLLVNNAGISYVGLLSDMSYNDWRSIIDTNLTSVFNTCNIIIPSMVSRKQGHIINISSMWGQVGASMEVAYSASKGGVDTFTKALAKELAPSNIQINAISCGVVDTPMNSCFSPEDMELLKSDIPSDRICEAKEVAELIKLIDAAPAYMTGQIIRIDGGLI